MNTKQSTFKARGKHLMHLSFLTLSFLLDIKGKILIIYAVTPQ